jgi:hypothetical protein
MINRQIILFSLISVIIGLIIWVRGNRILTKGKRSVAKIISNSYKPDNDGEGGGVFYPTIHFVTDKNESVTKELSIGTLPARTIGATLNVVYDPENPDDFVTSPGTLLVILPRILVAAGLTGIVVGLICLMLFQ